MSTPVAPPGPPPGTPPPPPPPAPPARTDLPTADLERRYYAHVVDRALAWTTYAAVAGLGWWLLDGPVVVALLVLGWALVVQVALAVLLGLRGLSPGKALLGLRAVSAATGRPVGVGAALLRGLVVGLAGLPTLLLGAATLAWTSASDRDRQRRGWHDHLAGTVVVDLRPVPEAQEPDEARPRAIVNLTAMRLVPETVRPAVTATRPPTTPPRGSRPSPPSSPPADPPAGARRRAVPTDSPTPPAGWQVELDSGERVVVDGLVLLGRGPVAGPGEQVRHLVPLRSQDMSVSKTHAQLQVAADGALVVMDRGSTNGSVVLRAGVSRELTPGKPLTLLEGDTVRLGDRSLRVLQRG
ncbi:MAG: RDD family protein [Nocardioides marinisabuli]|uniref:RDD family protein n=1 Tax=Nocardioides marinisabuli TaxID=419476 RepID=UPI00321BFA09